MLIQNFKNLINFSNYWLIYSIVVNIYLNYKNVI